MKKKTLSKAAKLLATYMEEKDKSFSDVGKILDVSHETVRQWTQGHLPLVSNALKIEQKLNIGVRDWGE